jgi:hypothetical protein
MLSSTNPQLLFFKKGKTMNKTCLGVISLLLLIISVGVYKFVFQGNVIESTDGRISIQLNSSERDLVLQEMRAFLSSVQQITQAVTEEDMETIAKSAKVVGKAAQGAVPGTLVGKLPLEFKQLGFDTHIKFDELALNAEDFGDTNQVLTQLSTLMQNCVACHAAYRIDVADE